MEIRKDLDWEKIEEILQGELKVCSYNVGITILLFHVSATDFLCLIDISKWIVNDVILRRLDYSTMKDMERFYMFDDEELLSKKYGMN